MSNYETSTITLARREALAKVTSGALGSIPAVTHIAVGDGGTDDAGNPLTPSETQTALNHELARYPVSSVGYPSPATVRYTVDIPAGDLAGEVINEAALLDASGTAAAIKTMYDKRKDSDVVFAIEFDDEF